MRLDDAVTYFLGEWPSEGPATDTWRSYGGQLKWLLGFAKQRGKVMLADLTPDLLRAAMRQKMDPKNHSLAFKGGESGANALAAATRKMAVWLLAQGVPVADLSVVKSPRVPERVQKRLKPEEFKAMEGAVLKRLVSSGRRIPRLTVARDLALLYMLADTGLRANEVCAMDVQDVDFSTASILVIRGKGKKQRALSIVDPNDAAGGVALRLLGDWIDLRESVRGVGRSHRLWISMKGNPLSRDELRKILGRICEQAGIADNRPPHTFRRSWFTESYKESPGSIRVLAARMGWSDKSHHMIDVYTRGAEVEIARDTPMPSISARWHEASPKVRGYSDRSLVPIPFSGARPGGGKADGPPVPTQGRRDTERTASASPRRGSRY